MAGSFLRSRHPFKRGFSPPYQQHFSSSAGRNQHTERSDFLGCFLEQHQPPQSTLDYFTNACWTRRVMSDADYEIVPFFSRYFNDKSGENRFFGHTVNTKTAIPRVLSLRRKNLKTPGVAYNAGQTGIQQSPSTENPPGVIALMSLGRDLEAHPFIVHGGFQGVIFDEVMRFLVLLHQDKVATPGPRDAHYTANMSISYRAPVVTTSDVLVRCWLKERQGRKWFTEADIVDREGRILTQAQSMWITEKQPVL